LRERELVFGGNDDLLNLQAVPDLLLYMDDAVFCVIRSFKGFLNDVEFACEESLERLAI